MNRFLTIFFSIALAGFASAYSFSDIDQWTGTGASRAALVIDWFGGPQPEVLAWGYRFDGAKTGRNMLDAIVAADPRLSYELVSGVSYTAVFSFGYDLDGGGLGSGDHYAAGWFTNGFWSYYNEVSPGSNFPAWTFGNAGFEDRLLVDGSWDGWSWYQDYNGSEPRQPVPEPLTMIPLAGGFLALSKRKK
ncbi:MAG: hypothetical protein JST40_04155 [Armatimonadetes bacterium]|nr:hypothetical protein [Armatimonadota bacterium]